MAETHLRSRSLPGHVRSLIQLSLSRTQTPLALRLLGSLRIRGLGRLEAASYMRSRCARQPNSWELLTLASRRHTLALN